MLKSISHLALTVKEPARTAALFKDLPGARVLAATEVQRKRSGDHIALYFFDYDDHVFELDTQELEKQLAV
ncbi:MAG: hypothetical protein KGL13_06010 [Gammaproteobacteria bacterium]|nr:hypothetical protein [Gammaproteobacteria bacterium]MDE2346003.1 hypothetical protein [Gammaproteobacteria bacterium]